MQNGGGWVQIACKIAYVLNGRAKAKLVRPILCNAMTGGCGLCKATHFSKVEMFFCDPQGLIAILFQAR